MFNCITYVKFEYQPSGDEEYYLAGINLDGNNCLEVSVIESVLADNIPKVVKKNLKCIAITDSSISTSEEHFETLTDAEWEKELANVGAIEKNRRKLAERVLNKKRPKIGKVNAQQAMMEKLTEMGLLNKGDNND